MNKSIVSGAMAGTLAVVLVSAFSNVTLYAQGTSELIRPNEVVLKMDKDLGVPALRLGQGKLHQVDVTIVDVRESTV